MAVEFNKVKVIGDFDKNNFRGIVGASTPHPLTVRSKILKESCWRQSVDNTYYLESFIIKANSAMR